MKGCNDVNIVIDVVCLLFGVNADRVFARDRSADVSIARQVIMYLCATTLEMPQANIANVLGRDRATVAHAVRSVEEARDNRLFDLKIATLENFINVFLLDKPECYPAPLFGGSNVGEVA